MWDKNVLDYAEQQGDTLVEIIVRTHGVATLLEGFTLNYIRSNYSAVGETVEEAVMGNLKENLDQEEKFKDESESMPTTKPSSAITPNGGSKKRKRDSENCVYSPTQKFEEEHDKKNLKIIKLSDDNNSKKSQKRKKSSRTSADSSSTKRTKTKKTVSKQDKPVEAESVPEKEKGKDKKKKTDSDTVRSAPVDNKKKKSPAVPAVTMTATTPVSTPTSKEIGSPQKKRAPATPKAQREREKKQHLSKLETVLSNVDTWSSEDKVRNDEKRKSRLDMYKSIVALVHKQCTARFTDDMKTISADIVKVWDDPENGLNVKRDKHRWKRFMTHAGGLANQLIKKKNLRDAIHNLLNQK